MKSQRAVSRLRGRLSAVIALALVLTTIPATAFAAPPRVWIDPGHGGSDPGAVANATQEKDTNLEISRMVVAGLRRQGFAVGVSRNSDYFVGLRERPAGAGAFGADMFVSIHSNSVDSMRAVGDMTIYRTGAGRQLGADIMNHLAPLTPYGDIGNRLDVRGLAVLRGATMPAAVLVELLSVSKADEAARLNDPASQRAMAEAIVHGITDYYGLRYIAPGAPVRTVKAAALKPKPKAKPKAVETTSAAKPATATPAAEATKAPTAETTRVPSAESSATTPSVTTSTPATVAPAPRPAETRPYHPGDLSLTHPAEMDVVVPQPAAPAEDDAPATVLERALPFGALLRSLLR
jgi:N-acetylmuramoyl-L-alanine amidase